MGKQDKRIDTYIEKSAEFAQPILRHLRELVHDACPEVEETIKWGFPNFDYNGIMCGMSAFKQHAAFGFWKAELLSDPNHNLSLGEKSAMGSFGRLKKLSDLPKDKVLLAFIKEAMTLNEEGIKVVRKVKPATTKTLKIPAAFKTSLLKSSRAVKAFDQFSLSKKKEYVDWIAEAKTEVTRDKRIAQAMEWIALGKSRNWKYERK